MKKFLTLGRQIFSIDDIKYIDIDSGIIILKTGSMNESTEFQFLPKDVSGELRKSVFKYLNANLNLGKTNKWVDSWFNEDYIKHCNERTKKKK